MAKCYCMTHPDGRLCIITLPPKHDTPELVDQALQKTLFELTRSARGESPDTHWSPDTPRSSLVCVEVDSSELPASRELRSAWVLQGNRVVVDMAKARALGLAR